MHPLLILLLGTVVVIAGIVRLRIGAFFSLMLAALLVSFLAPGELADRVPRVLEALGGMAGRLSLIIACAAVIGKCMTESGAADRIVRGFLKLFGERRAPAALMCSGFALSMPVFFDTVFYLLVPLARALYRRTGKNYLLSILAISSGAAISHTLVPPTPGPLAVAGLLGVEVGMMMGMGVVVGFPVAVVGLWLAHAMQRRHAVPMRPLLGLTEEETPPQGGLPGLGAALLPIVLPVAMIALGTVVNALGAGENPPGWVVALRPTMSVMGDANVALLAAALAAVAVYVRQCRPGREGLHATLEAALMSAATILLITAAGAAFGAMLKEAGVGAALQGLFSSPEHRAVSGMTLLVSGFAISSLLKISQGSTTVAMITAAGLMAAMLEDGTALPFHPVYLALAIGFGGLFIVWMNDSGFWIIARMSGLTETETLKTWSLILAIMALVGLGLTLLLAQVMPMAA
ncbi:MAG: hypothetical protein KDK99_15580 [Verrucomicrobiales bacterium]|nr:hypothetical protein [Verrucomicrobiales bacterium]